MRPWQTVRVPADYSPSVLVTGVHTPYGAMIASRFYRGGWFVLGSDTTRHCSYQARNHLTASLDDPGEAGRAGERAATIANGLDLVIAVPDEHGVGEESAHVLEHSAPVVTVSAGTGESVDWIVHLSTGGERFGWSSGERAPEEIAEAVWDLVDIPVPRSRYQHSH